MTVLLSFSDQQNMTDRELAGLGTIRRYKSECPGCFALVDSLGRYRPGWCGPACLCRPHRLADEPALLDSMAAA